LPPTVDQLLTHVLGSDTAFAKYYLNWLSYVFQTGFKPQTAWLFSGTTGTGKGTWFHHVLCPLFGESNCLTRRLDQLEDNFDGDLSRKRIMWMDEVNIEKLRNKEKVFNKMNNLVTENFIGIRQMYKEHEMHRNYLAIMAASNSYNPLKIDHNDRRWNVSPRQEMALRNNMMTGPTLHRMLAQELEQFAAFLFSYKVDEDAVKEPLDSEAKRNIQAATMDSPSEIIQKLKTGDFSYFLALLPAPGSPLDTDLSSGVEAKLTYMIKVLELILDAVIHNDGRVRLCRDDLMAIFNATIGWTHSKRDATKFTKALVRYGLPLSLMRIPGTAYDRNSETRQQGAEFVFHATQEDIDEFMQFHAKNKPALKSVT
jgi:hypothetical protein